MAPKSRSRRQKQAASVLNPTESRTTSYSKAAVVKDRTGQGEPDDVEQQQTVFRHSFLGRMFEEALQGAVEEADWDVSDSATALLREAFNIASVEAASTVKVNINATIDSPIDPTGRYPLYNQHLGHAKAVGKDCTLRMTPSTSRQV